MYPAKHNMTGMATIERISSHPTHQTTITKGVPGMTLLDDSSFLSLLLPQSQTTLTQSTAAKRPKNAYLAWPLFIVLSHK